MYYGYGPTTPWSYTPQWGNPFGPNTGFGMGYGFSPTGYAPSSWSNFGTFPATTGYGWTPMTDDELEYFVEQSIDNDPTVPAHANIDVAVNDSVVTLSGTVPNKRIKHAAGDDAWWIPQVIDVHNEINVQPRTQRAGGQPSVSQPSRRSANR